MKAKNFPFLLVIAILALFVGRCWGADIPEPKFFSGTPHFESDKEFPGALVYRKPDVKVSYTKVLIDPIEIWVAEDSEYKGIDPDEVKVIADSLRQTIVKELEPEYPVVEEAGEGVLGIRLAITNVYIKTKKRGLLGYTPIGFVVTTIGNLAGLRTELNKATIEAELLDGGTNEQLGALIDPLGSDSMEEASWEELGKRLEAYAKRLRARLDERTGKSSK
jgi:Protein of unknown function (DUF3313)